MTIITELEANGTPVTVGAALDYWRRGWAPIPLHPSKKQPINSSWTQLRYETEPDVERAFSKGQNVGVVLGAASGGLVDVDVDCSEGALIAQRHALPTTGAVFSRDSSKSVHLLYRVTGEMPDTQRYSGLVELRSTGAQTMFPPSTHPEGSQVAWLLDGEPGLIDGVELWRSVARFAAVLRLAKAWPRGAHHDATLALAGGLLRAGWDRGQVDDFVRYVCMAAGDTEELDDDRMQAVRSTDLAMQAGGKTTGWPSLAQLVGDQTVTDVLGWLEITPLGASDLLSGETFTDVGNARRFVDAEGEDSRFSVAHDKWIRWNGSFWEADGSEQIFKKAMAVTDSMIREAANVGNPDLKKKMVTHALRSQGKQSIANMVFLARPLLAVEPRELDRDPFLFNAANGVVDLRTGQLREARREDFMTVVSPVAYDPDARSPLWEHFLYESTGGDADLMAFLQRAVGYSLTGDASEEKLFFIHGRGATGKSTFLEAVKAMLGGYSATADFESFLKRSNTGGARSDLARLVGKRFVASVEVDEGKQLAEGLVKQITGGDKLTVRHLYREEFEYDPQFKLWLSANHSPRVSADDDAMWRRILLIPMDNVVPEDRRDPHLKPQLKDPDTEGRAVLAWAVAGCLAWQKQRLGVPNVVKQATEEYRVRMDVVSEFVQERLVMDGYERIRAGLLLENYNEWARERNYPRENMRSFGSKVQERIGPSVKVGGNFWYDGYRLRRWDDD